MGHPRGQGCRPKNALAAQGPPARTRRSPQECPLAAEGPPEDEAVAARVPPGRREAVREDREEQYDDRHMPLRTGQVRWTFLIRRLNGR